MATFVGPKNLAPTGTTGANTHQSVFVEPGTRGLAAQFVVEVIGGTPTVTFLFQGSFDNVNFYPIPYFTAANDTVSAAGIAVTSVAGSVVYLDTAGGSRFFEWVRCVTTSNTNVTYRAELYCNVGS